MKKFFQEFKDFISKGNVVDLAVGVIIGGAFTNIVNSLTTDILTPIIGMISGGVNVADLSVTVGGAVLKYGSFLNAIINFLLIALVLFCFVKAINTARDKADKMLKKNKAEEPAAPAPVDPQIELLTQIRDLLEKEEKK